MKVIEYHKNFKKNFRKRISLKPKLLKRFKERLDLFIKDQHHFLLKDHALIGKKNNYRSFSITGDVRVVYKVKDNIIQLYDIGTHNQVY